MFSMASDICSWPESETKSRLSSVFARADAAFRGERIEYLGGHRDPRYRYKDSTLIEMLGVSEEEMRLLCLRHLVTDEIKRERDRERKRALRRAAGVIPRQAYLADSLSQTKPWVREGISRRTWERRIASTAPPVASPSGCMVAEPMFLRNLGELGQSPVSQLCASTATNILIQEKRLQLCLFSDLHSARGRSAVPHVTSRRTHATFQSAIVQAGGP
jgi:hypothetical protein